MRLKKESNHIVREQVNNGSAVLIDVREKIEFNEKALEGAINFPLSEYQTSSFDQFRDKVIYLICFSGNRSKRIAKRLFRDAGIEAVLVEDQMEKLLTINQDSANRGWTIDRQFRMTLGILLVVFLFGFNWVSPYFIAIPIILATGLVITSILNKCYMRMGIAILPWNKNRV